MVIQNSGCFLEYDTVLFGRNFFYFSVLKMKSTISLQMSLTFYKTTIAHISEEFMYSSKCVIDSTESDVKIFLCLYAKE